MDWHQRSIEDMLRETDSSLLGLSDKEAKERLASIGPNELVEKKKKPAWIIFLLQFKDFMILVLIAAAIISGIIGDLTDSIIILVIVLLNSILGFIQEYRAEKAMEALKKMAALQAQVIRDGNVVHITSSELVPGDLVILEAGNAVPADMRLTETYSLVIDESALTGESVPVDKQCDAISEEEVPVGDRLNMAYKSTLVTGGRGRGVVVATGMNTEIGRIAALLQEEKVMTPLQKRMADFGRKLSYLILIICLLLLGIGLLRGEEPFRMILLSISLAVAAIPEALPALITIALSRGANRLVKKNALIRKLPAVETLGSVTFICSDKTGTLTENKMKVMHAEAFQTGFRLEETVSMLETSMALNQDVSISADGSLSGDPTEVALVAYFLEHHGRENYDRLHHSFPRVAELPFDSDRKCMTTVHRSGKSFVVISKGAVESIEGSLTPAAPKEIILDKANQLATGGMRVLAYAFARLDALPEPFSYDLVEKDLEFAGLAGMIDPPRSGVDKAIAACKTAGIRTVMITGDHPATAATIARGIGILTEKDILLTGLQLKNMQGDEFTDMVEKVRVYARVSPEQKLKIVNALQRKGQFVSMTGDGVNDAPSLRKADIGVAMGINGTDVSKEAADMILLDDNFTTIVRAVREGRRIYDNIRKFVKYIMTCNGAEIWTIFLAPFIGLPIPLLPIHLLWINLVTDGLPGLALAGEKEEEDIMERPPRKTSESLFANGIGFHIVWVGLLMAGVTLGIQAWAIGEGKDYWQTMVFTVLAITQLGHVMAIRSERQYLFRHGLLSNAPLLGAVLLTILLQMAVVYFPFCNLIFKTKPLPFDDLLLCFGVSLIVMFAVEFEKFIKRNFLNKG